jgi:serine/threonine protein kinase
MNSYERIKRAGYIMGEILDMKPNVFLCTSIATNVTYVCKIARTPIEVRVLVSIRKNPHDSLAALHDLKLLQPNPDLVYLEVIEYYGRENGWVDLFDFIQRQGDNLIPTTSAQTIFKNVVEGLTHLSELGFYHGDIKRNN